MSTFSMSQVDKPLKPNSLCSEVRLGGEPHLPEQLDPGKPMNREWFSENTASASHALVALFMLAGMLAAWSGPLVFSDRMRRIALSSAIGGMALSAIGMAAGFAGVLAPMEGALLQEVIDLAAILNSLRMILPSAPLSDFTVDAEAESAAPRSGTTVHRSRTLNQAG